MSTSDTNLNIVLAQGTFADARIEQEAARGRATVREASLATPADVASNTADAHAVIVTINPLTAAHIAALGKGVRMISRAGIGLDAIDLEAARARGISVYHFPDYATAEVATHAVAMLLAVHRRLREADLLAREAWTEWSLLKPIHPIEDATIGIVGYGRIGRAVASRLRPFAKGIQAYDPVSPVSDGDITGVSTLEDLLRTSDMVSLHLPLTPKTTNLLGAAEIALMPAGAILVNVSRGGLVDETALAAALSAGHLGGAGFDVSREEPPAVDSPLYHAPRLLLSPHIAWYSERAEMRLRRNAVEAILAVSQGASPSTGRFAVEPL